MSTLYRILPSVDACLAALEEGDRSWFAAIPRPLVKSLINNFLDRLRERIRQNDIASPEELTLPFLLPALRHAVTIGSKPHFVRVINATGVVLHTNMGRAVLAQEAIEAVVQACSGYSNLELDLATGERGSRYSHVEQLLCTLTGAEAALVVNNNAAAVFLALNSLCTTSEVIVARGQLVEIGGSFRIPDVMTASGAVLREVGCTNRVHPHDYEKAITSETSALMRVHTSNYRVIGFTSDVAIEDLVAMAEKHGLYCIEDLGSGSLIDLAITGLPGEPTVRSVVSAGTHVVTFSGDKVLGGPQAGIIVGKREVLEKIKKNPLNRALRIDKMTLAALEATLRLYIDEKRACTQVPTLDMLLVSSDVLRQRADRLSALLRRQTNIKVNISTCDGGSRVGGGSFPENDLPTTLVRIESEHISAQELKERLLRTSPPLLGRLEHDAFCLDPRTLTEAEWDEVVSCLEQALADTSQG